MLAAAPHIASDSTRASFHVTALMGGVQALPAQMNQATPAKKQQVQSLLLLARDCGHLRPVLFAHQHHWMREPRCRTALH